MFVSRVTLLNIEHLEVEGIISAKLQMLKEKMEHDSLEWKQATNKCLLKSSFVGCSARS